MVSTKRVYRKSLVDFETFMRRTGAIIYGWSPNEKKTRETVSHISDSLRRVRDMGVTEACIVIPKRREPDDFQGTLSSAREKEV